jgi:hypothetical protein
MKKRLYWIPSASQPPERGALHWIFAAKDVEAAKAIARQQAARVTVEHETGEYDDAGQDRIIASGAITR